MRIHAISLMAMVLLAVCNTATASCAPDDAIAVSRAWWNAFSRGEVAYLEARTTDSLSVTLNNGRAFDRAQFLADAATHKQAEVSATWSDEIVYRLGESAAAVTARVTETVGSRPAQYRYLSVLQCSAGGWQMAVAQSTRELHETARVTAATAGNLEELAGQYRTPAGKAILVLADQSGLVLIDPTGARTFLEPIGAALFEARGVSVQGLIRFSFARGAGGSVVALNRITTEVMTFPRIATP